MVVSMRRKHLIGLLLGLVLLSWFDALPAEGDNVTLNRRAAVALNDQAVLKLNKGDYRRAINDPDKAILLDPDYEMAYQNRMTARHKSGENQGALEDYNELIRLDSALNPTLAVAYIQAKMGDYNKLIRLHPTVAFFYVCRGLARDQHGDNVGAIKDFDEGIRLAPAVADYYLYRGLSKEKLGDLHAQNDFNEEQRVHWGTRDWRQRYRIAPD